VLIHRLLGQNKCAIIWPWSIEKYTDRRSPGRFKARRVDAASGPRLRMFQWPAFENSRAPLSIVVYPAIRTSSARVNLLMVKFQNSCASPFIRGSGASFKMYHNAFQVFQKGNCYDQCSGSASGDQAQYQLTRNRTDQSQAAQRGRQQK
jgi:hypothetical protein